jgi:lysophospholipase L1-like esterase
MTVSSTLNKQIYVGNSTTKTFDYTFYTLAEGDLKLYLTNITTGVETEITTNYDVSPTGDAFPAESGTVTYPVVGDPITSNYKFTVIRDMTVLQPTVYPNNTALKPKVVEKSFDRITMISQQQQEKIDRTLKLSITVPDGISRQLPFPTANDVLGWNSTGTALENKVPAGIVVPTWTATLTAGGNDYTNTIKTADIISKGPWVDVRAFGGLDDYGIAITPTNSFDAILGIYSAYPTGCIIKLPKTISGVYYISGDAYQGDLSQYTLDPDPGVSIRFVGTFCPLIGKGVNVTKPLNIRIVDLGYTFHLGVQAYLDLSEKRTFLSTIDGEKTMPISLSGLYSKNYIITWPDGPVDPATPSVIVEDSVQWNPVSTTGFNLTTYPVRPGNELHAYFYRPGSDGLGLVCVGVLTDKGYSVVRQYEHGGPLISTVKSGTNPVIEVNIPFTTTPQVSYHFANALTGIKIHSARSYSVLVNGIEVAYVKDAGGNILEAGWGLGFWSSSTAGYIGGMVKINGKKSMGMRPLKIVVTGDSITDKNVPCSWTEYMRQYMSGFAGVQFLDINNIAVSGATSSSQKTSLLATSIEGYDYCLIQLGVNDIQGLTGVTNFTQTISDMIDYCYTNNVTPIVGVPTMFYEQSDAIPYGNTGQASVNSAEGSAYRAALLRMLYTKGVQANMLTLQDMGGITPSLLVTSGADSVLMDNIHPTAYGRMILGYGWAKTLASAINPKINKDTLPSILVSAWVTTGYGRAGSTYDIQGDLFSLSGYLTWAGTAITDGTVVMQLPLCYSPKSNKTLSIVYSDATGIPKGSCYAQISTVGTVTLYGVPINTIYFYLSGISYTLAE